MSDLMVEPVDVLGDTIMAAKDDENVIWVGINYFCQGLDMEKKQRDYQVEKVKADKTLKRGCRKFPAGVFDIANEGYALRLDFIPMWLAKITITKKMEQDHPELADKLLEYQLKAKDILAAAFLPKQTKLPTEPMELLELHYQALKKVDSKVDKAEQRIDALDKKLHDELMNLPLLGVESDTVDKALKSRGVEIAGGKESNAYKDKNLLRRIYWDLHGQLRREFGVSTYKAIKRNQTDLALKFLAEYKPPLHLREQIENVNAQQTLDLEGGTGI